MIVMSSCQIGLALGTRCSCLAFPGFLSSRGLVGVHSTVRIGCHMCYHLVRVVSIWTLHASKFFVFCGPGDGSLLQHSHCALTCENMFSQKSYCVEDAVGGSCLSEKPSVELYNHHAIEESAQADRDIAIMKYMAKHKAQAGVPANV